MTHFKYDIVTLIELVESKPCILDKTNENNKNKILRDKSWHEIFHFLDDGYEQLSQAEKKKTGDLIMGRWSNIRDAFMRSLKTKSGQGAKSRYIYGEHLQFLLKIAQKDETESNYSQAGIKDDNIQAEDLTDSQLSIELPQYQPKPTPQIQPTASNSKEYRAKAKKQMDDIEREILLELKQGKQSVETCSHHHRSEQELLLVSFLPYIRDLSEGELMKLQMEVLTTIQKIKQQRGSNPRPFQQHRVYSPPIPQQYIKAPLPSPAMSHSHFNQSFDYQSPPPSNQMEQHQSNQTFLTVYTEGQNYQELIEEDVE